MKLDKESIGYSIGDKVRLVGRNPYHSLKTGQVCTVTDIQEGIFSDRPYTIVKDDKGREYAAHYWRFELIDNNGS